MPRGRPRRQCERQPNGQPRRSEDARAVVVAQRLKFGAQKETVLGAEHECELGRQFRAGIIGKDAYDAGCRFRAADMRYRQAHGLPSPHVAAQDTNPGGRSLAAPMDDDAIAAVRKTYAGMLNAMSLAERSEVTHVVIYDRRPMMAANLAAGLAALVKHLGGR